MSLKRDNLEYLMLAANLLAGQDLLARAAQLCKDVIRRAPRYAEAYNNLGLLSFETGKLTDAKVEFERAIREKPGDAAAHYNLGLTLQKIGDGASANVQFETAHRLDPSLVSDH